MKYKLIINLKTYKETTGKKAIKLAQIVKKLKRKASARNVEIILCPQLVDIKEVVAQGVSVYAQHIDHVPYGAYTGHVLPEVLKSIKVKGALISHSELNFAPYAIKPRVEAAKMAGLEVCVCARNDKIAEIVSKFKPHMVAVEPKSLIGGNISISTAKPELIKNSKKAVGRIPLLVGAGVKNAEDVRVGVKLGARGILVASGVVKAKDPQKAIEDLLSGFPK